VGAAISAAKTVVDIAGDLVYPVCPN
jgi:hypothetical protein